MASITQRLQIRQMVYQIGSHIDRCDVIAMKMPLLIHMSLAKLREHFSRQRRHDTKSPVRDDHFRLPVASPALPSIAFEAHDP
jgi:hypothetical protein